MREKNIFQKFFYSPILFSSSLIKDISKIINSRNIKLKEALKEVEKIAQLPINNPHPLIQIGFDGRIIFASPAALKHYPLLQEQGFDHPILSGLDDFMSQVKKNPAEKNIITREVSYGFYTYHQTISAVITNDEPALIIYSYDITNIKQTEEKARLLEAAIVGAKDGVIITTADVKNPEIIYVNEAFTKISGYDPEDVIGETPRILQGSGTDKRTLARLKQALIEGRSFQGELRNYTKTGKAYWLDISIVPVRDHHGKITHFAAIERDISDRKVLEKYLQATKESAEVASRAKSDFLANMSHELRTPMNGIIGLSELLLDMGLNGDQKELATAVNSSSRNLLTLLNDILDLSKIEAGELTLEYIDFNLRRAIGQTIDLLRPAASKKGIVLEKIINPIVPERIVGDPARLQQILNNLVSNAIKFTDTGYVRLDVSSIKREDGNILIQIRVEDTGIGIPEDKQEIVFHKFTQADVSTSRKYGGTGLGLAITKELIGAMNGVITLDSIVGKGTTFYVEIPALISKQTIPSDERKTMRTRNTPINTFARILVVDDHPVNLLFMRKTLKKMGFDHVDEAHGGLQAVSFTQKLKYDLIFMDCQMPEMDGFEASEKIRAAEDPQVAITKIIAVTADAMKGAKEKCLASGMNDYISKPVDVEKLKAVLHEWLPGTAEQIAQQDSENTVCLLPKKSNVIDWERLNMFTDGNPDEEQELICMFTAYAEESIDILKKCCDAPRGEDWKKAAHKLKGSAANLGAYTLSDICFEGEKAAEEDARIKEEILSRILSAYSQVCHELGAEKIQA